MVSVCLIQAARDFGTVKKSFPDTHIPGPYLPFAQMCRTLCLPSASLWNHLELTEKACEGGLKTPDKDIFEVCLSERTFIFIFHLATIKWAAHRNDSWAMLFRSIIRCVTPSKTQSLLSPPIIRDKDITFTVKVFHIRELFYFTLLFNRLLLLLAFSCFPDWLRMGFLFPLGKLFDTFGKFCLFFWDASAHFWYSFVSFFFCMYLLPMGYF